MPRKRVVSRTLETTEVTALFANLEDKSITERKITLPILIKNNERLMRAVRHYFETETLKLVDVIKAESVCHRYVMDEEEFINLARIEDVRGEALAVEIEEVENND